MLSEENGKYCYTWKIVNYSLCPQKNGEYLSSSFFTAENVGHSVWRMALYPKGRDENYKEYVSLFIERSAQDTIDDVIDVGLNVEFVKPDGGILSRIQEKNAMFKRGTRLNSPRSIKIYDLAQEMEKWEEDVLVLHCIIVNRKKLNSESQTKFVADHCVFKWNIEIQGLIQRMEKEFSMCDLSLFQINLISSCEDIKISISKTHNDDLNNSKLISCRISLLGKNDDKVVSKRATHMFDSEETSSVWEFPTFVSVTHLKDKENSLLKNGIFTLLFEFSSLKNEIPIYVGSPICNNFNKIQNILSLKDDLQEMHCSNLHSDIKLNVEGKVFQAHKCVLAALSDVFSAMFSQDMLESRTGIINISDVDVDVFESFLKYIYSAEVDNMDYETARKLMIIADKYQVKVLSIHCSFVLRSHLSKTNVYEILTLADTVNYEPLKILAFDFIAEHAKEILTSSEWVTWAVSNVKLSAELVSSIVVNSEMVPRKFKK